MYTIERANGERNLVLEHGLKQLEEEVTLEQEKQPDMLK
jgi:hypothetical protein